MKTYLVTGGAGFIGSNYIHYMFKKYKDIKIVNLDKLTYAGNPENLKEFENNENYVFIKEDICNAEAVNKIFQEYDIDRVVHFAAESHVDRSIKNPEIFVQTNVIGTTVLLNAARNGNRKTEPIKKGKSSSMYQQMRYMDLWKRMEHSFMRQHRIHHTAHIQQVKHLQTCW